MLASPNAAMTGTYNSLLIALHLYLGMRFTAMLHLPVSTGRSIDSPCSLQAFK